MKKALSIFLSVVMLLSITAGIDFSAYAASYSGTCGDNLTWSLDTDTGVLTIDGSGDMTDYSSSKSIPWYSYRTSITDVELLSGITSIGSYAFYNCTSLISIVISESVISIGWNAFRSCTSLTSITIPNSVTSISGDAFRDCTSLTSVTIPDSVTSIGYEAFDGCTSLTSITIPDSVTSIGMGAFEGCTSLTSITIPDSVTSIGNYAFSHCTSLTNIDVDENNEYYTSQDGILFNKDKTELIQYPAENERTFYEISDSVTSIGGNAFYGCKKLSSVTIPDSVTSIGWGAFDRCTSLTNIAIPDSVTSIGECVFEYCTGLTSVTIGNSVTSIGEWVFVNCSNLTSITISDSVTSIGDYAFSGCTSLTDVYYTGSEDDWNNISIGSNNSYLTNATIHYNSSGADTSSSVVFLEDELVAFSVSSEYSTPLKNVNFAYSSLTTSTGNSDTKLIGYAALEQYDITVSKDDFRDYIIPQEVGASFKASDTKKFNIYLTYDTKDSKPYVSTVFARNNEDSETNAYSEVQKTALTVVDGSKQDVIISANLAGASSATYYLSQDSSHRISNTTGVFKAVDLYSRFEKNSPVYAYVVTSDGDVSEPVELKLEVKTIDSDTLDFLNESTIDIIGSSGMGITLSDSVPLIGGADLSLDLVEFPLGVSYDASTGIVKLSFGMDIFESESSMGSVERINNWKTFKDAVKTCVKSVKGSVNKLDQYNKLAQSVSYFGGKLATYSEKNNSFTAGFLGYAEGKVVNGSIVFTDVCGTVPLSFSFKYTQQGAVWVVPAYFYVQAGADVSLEIGAARQLADSNVPLDFYLTVDAEPSLKLGGGAGVKGAVSAGIWGSGSIPTLIEFADSHFKLSLKGEFGVEAEFFIFKGDLTLLSGEVTAIDKYFGTSSIKSYAFNRFNSIVNGETENNSISLASRDYASDTSDWLGDELDYATASSDGSYQNVSISNLQESVYSNSQTQLIQFGDKLMMVYIEDDTSRDTYNRYRLMYSIYENGEWSDPKAVADNGCMDSAPSLATDGTNVYVAWQNISEQITDVSEDSVDKIMSSSEIRIAKYDAQSDEFTDVQTVTDNNVYDYYPSLSVVDGEPYLYWASCSDNDLTSGSVSVMKYADSQITQLDSNLGYVTELASNGSNYAYVADTDGDTSTTEDLMIFENGTSADTSSESCSNPLYGTIDGETCLFYTNSDNICYISNGQVNNVFSEYNGAVSELTCINGDSSTTLVWTQTTDNGGSEIYTCSYSNGEWSSPIQLTDSGNLVSSISAVEYNNQLYAAFSSTERVQTENSNGDTYYENGQSNLCFMKSDDFTDLSVSVEYIDETAFEKGSSASFVAFLENNGTQDIQAVQITVSDTLGNSVDYDKEINLKSGAQTSVNLTYDVPDDFENTTITVTAECDGDVVESNNSAEYEVGTANISVGEITYDELDDVFVISSVIENDTLIDAEDVVVEVIGGDDETLIGTIEVGAVNSGEQYAVEYTVDKSMVSLNDDGIYTVKFVVKSSNSQTEDENDYSIVAVTPYHNHEYTATVTEPTCTEKGYTTYTCSCGETYVDDETDATGHTYDSGVVTKTATCSATGVKTYTCTVCGATKTETIAKIAHTVVTDKAVAATCTKTGLTAGSHCSVCGTVIKAQTTVAKLAHTYTNKVTKATLSKNGKITPTCSVCGATKSATTIYYPKTIKLSSTSYTYDGDKHKPSVTVKDSKGNRINSKYYTVTYSNSKSKSVGKYTVTIKFKGNYSGTKTLTYTIKPKSTSISKITAKSKGFTVKWKKQATQTTGYQIQYSTSKDFSNAKTVTVSKTGTTSKTIKKLKSKKKYYVRVRTYKTVKVNGKSTKIYSSWSKTKTVTTKK